MSGSDIRWLAVIPTTLLTGLAVVFVETARLAPASLSIRPDWLWGMAAYVALRAAFLPAITFFFWCGLMRDVFIGTRLGAGCIAFVLIGWLVLCWRSISMERGWLGQVILVGGSVVFVAAIRRSLEAGRTFADIWGRIAVLSLGEGLLTAMAMVPIIMLLSFTAFSPWREGDRYR